MGTRATPARSVVVPPELEHAARRAAGLTDVSLSALVRVALAGLAGEDPDRYALRMGRPPRQTDREGTAA
jgi:hypothetical protein